MIDKISQGIDLARKSLTSFVLLVSILIFILASDATLAGIGGWGRERLRLLGFSEFNVLGGSLNLGTQVADLSARADELRSASTELQSAGASRGEGAPSGEVGRVVEKLDAIARNLDARSNTLLKKATDAARPVAADAASMEGWIYLGRKDAAQRWAPPLDRLSLAERDGKRWLTLGKDVILVEKSPTAAASSEGGSDDPVHVVSAGDSGIEVLGISSEASIGDGQLQWVKVRVPAARLKVVK